MNNVPQSNIAHYFKHSKSKKNTRKKRKTQNNQYLTDNMYPNRHVSSQQYMKDYELEASKVLWGFHVFLASVTLMLMIVACICLTHIINVNHMQNEDFDTNCDIDWEFYDPKFPETDPESDSGLEWKTHIDTLTDCSVIKHDEHEKQPLAEAIEILTLNEYDYPVKEEKTDNKIIGPPIPLHDDIIIEPPLPLFDDITMGPPIRPQPRLRLSGVLDRSSFFNKSNDGDIKFDCNFKIEIKNPNGWPKWFINDIMSDDCDKEPNFDFNFEGGNVLHTRSYNLLEPLDHINIDDENDDTNNDDEIIENSICDMTWNECFQRGMIDKYLCDYSEWDTKCRFRHPIQPSLDKFVPTSNEHFGNDETTKDEDDFIYGVNIRKIYPTLVTFITSFINIIEALFARPDTLSCVIMNFGKVSINLSIVIVGSIMDIPLLFVYFISTPPIDFLMIIGTIRIIHTLLFVGVVIGITILSVFIFGICDYLFHYLFSKYYYNNHPIPDLQRCIKTYTRLVFIIVKAIWQFIGYFGNEIWDFIVTGCHFIVNAPFNTFNNILTIISMLSLPLINIINNDNKFPKPPPTITKNNDTNEEKPNNNTTNNNNINEEKLCTVCMVEFPNTIILPCKHQALCVTCSLNYKERNILICPLCRGEFDQIMQVY